MPSCFEDPRLQCVSRWTLFALTIVSIAFAIAAVASCDFVTLVVPAVTDDFLGDDFFDDDFFANDDDGTVSTGLFSFRNPFTDSCHQWKAVGVQPSDFPATFNTARGTSIVAVLLLGMALMGICLMMFVQNKSVAKTAWLVTKILYILVLVCLCLSNVIFSGDGCDTLFDDDAVSDYETDCQLGPAAIANAVNIFLVAGVAAYSWFVSIPVEGRPCCGGASPASTPSNPEQVQVAEEETGAKKVPTESIPEQAAGDSNHKE